MWCALFLPILAHAVSNGNLPYCNVFAKIGKGTSIMKWVQTPVFSDQYTVTAPSGSYVPGQLTPIKIDVKNIDLTYIGLVLYAVDNTETQVGEWTVRKGDAFFTPPGCQYKAVVHQGAELKPISTTFYWTGQQGMGTVKFRVLIKQGEQNKGNFYWPQTNLTLTEGAVSSTPQTVWKSPVGASCDHTCALQGKACDQAGTLALNSASALDAATKSYYPCRKFIRSCGPPASGASDYCYFNNCTGGQMFDSATTCSRRSVDPLMSQQFCACQAGAQRRDPVPPEATMDTGLGVRLAAPVELDSDLTLNSLEIKDGMAVVEMTGPQDRWFAIGWDTDFMRNAYATVVWLNNPAIGKPQTTGLTNFGVNDGLQGWYDVKCQQALVDYCRTIGSPQYFSCAMDNTTNYNSPASMYNSANISRVPCKNGKPAPFLPMTVTEYILNDNPRGAALATRNNITVLSTFTNNGRFTIKWTRPLAGNRTFPERSEFPIIWAVGGGQYFNQDTKHVKKMESPTTLKLAPVYPVCLSSAAARLPGFFLLAALGTLTSKSVFFGALLALFAQPALAHNWVNTPSRAQVAAVSIPCQARVDPAPHLQVAPGQQFHLEWSTGHGESPTSWTYWVFVHESDYDKLYLMKEGDLESYLDKAPPTAVLSGPPWQKRHLAPLTNSVPGCTDCNNNTAGLYEQPALTPSDPRFLTRNNIAVQKSIHWYDKNVTQWFYQPQHLSGDKRAEYYNAQFPWMISVHKFRVINHYPNEYDVATFQFRATKGAGNYIAHYYWGGYRDCVDVDLRSDGLVANPWGLVGGNITSTFARLDHCEFTHVLNPSAACTVMKNSSAAKCLSDCLKRGGCTGVQAVPYVNPAGTFSYTPNYPTKLYTYNDSASGIFPPPEFGPCDSRTVNKRVTCPDVNPQCNATVLAQTATSGDYICYALNPYRDQDFQVAEDYVTTTDPKDPKFFSTCWVRLAPGGFLPSTQQPATPPPVWQVGDRCVSCDWLKNTYGKLPNDNAPRWVESLTDDCEDCNLKFASMCPPDSAPVDGGNPGSCASPANNSASCSAACDSGFSIFGPQRVCSGGVRWGGPQQCVFSGCPTN